MGSGASLPYYKHKFGNLDVGGVEFHNTELQVIADKMTRIMRDHERHTDLQSQEHLPTQVTLGLHHLSRIRAYIAYGEILVRGTVEEVIKHSHLTTYTVSGDDIAPLQAALDEKLGVDMVAPFGTSLHVSGRDAAKLEAAIKPYRGDKKYKWERSEPSLEDVFIDLMQKSKDNFQ